MTEGIAITVHSRWLSWLSLEVILVGIPAGWIIRITDDTVAEDLRTAVRVPWPNTEQYTHLDGPLLHQIRRYGIKGRPPGSPGSPAGSGIRSSA